MFSKSEQYYFPYYFPSCRCILHFSFDAITIFSYTICGHHSASSHDTPHPIVSYVTLIRMTGIPSTSKKETLNDANYDEWHVRVMLNIGRLPLVTQWIMGKRPDFAEEPLFVPQWRDEDRREPVVHGEYKVGGLRGQQVRLVSPRFHPAQLEGICLGLMTEHLQELEGFAEALTQHDLRHIMDAARDCSLDAGVASMYADLIDLLNIKISDATWQLFFNRYVAIMRRIKQRGMSAEEQLQAFFDVRFIMALQSSTALKDSVKRDMEQPRWRHVHELVPAYSNVLRQLKATKRLTE